MKHNYKVFTTNFILLSIFLLVPVILEKVIFLSSESYILNERVKNLVFHKEIIPKESLFLLSTGKIRSRCNVLVNNVVVYTGINQVIDSRSEISINVPITLSPGMKNDVIVKCDKKTLGFSNKIPNNIVVTTIKSGFLLSFVRMFYEQWIGPISSLILLFLVISSINTDILFNKNDLLKFSLIGVFYTFSLSYYTRIFLWNGFSSLIHPFFRVLLSLYLYRLISNSFGKKRKLILVLHYLFLASLMVTAHAKDFNYFILIYRSFYIIFPITLLTLLFDIIRRKDKRNYFVISVVFFSVFYNFVDFFKINDQKGSYSAPIIIAILLSAISYIIIQNLKLSRKTDTFIARLFKLLDKEDKTIKLINEFGRIILDLSPYKKVSVYIDDYFQGNTQKPLERYTKTLSIGYQDEDFRVNTITKDSLSKSPYIEKALNTMDVFHKNFKLRKKVFFGLLGQDDKDALTIIPLGKFAVICLSGLKNKKDNEFSLFKNVLSNNTKIINNFVEKIRLIGIGRDLSLFSLRSKTGDICEEIDLGAIFIDIVDYSKNTTRYGKSYSRFIESILFLDLVRKTKQYALPERIVGDEVVLISCKYINDELDSYQLTLKAILSCIEFFDQEAQELSFKNGFGKLKYRISCSYGEGVLIIDGVSGRSNGRPPINASRFLKYAKEGELVTDLKKEDIEMLLNEKHIKGKVEDRIIQVKQDKFKVVGAKVAA